MSARMCVESRERKARMLWWNDWGQPGERERESGLERVGVGGQTGDGGSGRERLSPD